MEQEFPRSRKQRRSESWGCLTAPTSTFDLRAESDGHDKIWLYRWPREVRGHMNFKPQSLWVGIIFVLQPFALRSDP